MDSSIGTEFAGHRIEAVIGRGGASIVYLAEHLRLGRKAALKVLAPHLADDEAFRERFIRESRIAAGLDHPNIVTVYDAGEVDGSLYISMRYVEGSDLGELLGAEKALEPSRAVSILAQVASALDTAHAAGLVHRDVKPGNILVETVGSAGFDRAYLSDFGISKRTATIGGLTRTGQFVGTVDYVAPEQITGESVDGRADVYSLGCVLFQCLSGRVPFPRPMEVATIYSHLHDAPPLLEAFVDSSEGLEGVVATALAKDKRDRYDTCSALIEAARIELKVAVSEITDVRSTPAAGAHVTSGHIVEAQTPHVAGMESAPPSQAGDRPRLRVAGSKAEPSPITEERKVVSVLFVDLVGVIAKTDQPDPEDVKVVFRLYHERLKREIERFGGTVEKFVGDAVTAVFGAPVAHEDDAERAVRAALHIAEAIEELNEERPGLDLAIRAAVNTGEALVTLGARPEAGEGFVTGDVVNVASRLQAIERVGGVVVGEFTYRATRGVIEYEELEPVTVKGKEQALPVWRAIGARSRFGVDVEQRTQIPLIGRDHELNLLRELFGRVTRDEAVQLVTIVGEPGVGKSRLVWEFQRFVDDFPDIVYWRQGRCLPYGEGITFWALGEVVKSHAGILESDTPEGAAAKLEMAVSSVVDEESERDWIRSRLEPLLGLGEAQATEREESFTAWRSFLESIASQNPFVLVIEDMHWADAAMLTFVEHLAGWASRVPLFVLCTARPELYERDPAWGSGKRNHTAISLSPLSPDETAQLIGALLDQAVLPAETQTALLARAGGNPLFAEEFIRMLVDRGVLARSGASWDLTPGEEEIPVPETVQALIAARLDTLSPERKALLQDAAVIGKVFWAGALAEMGGIDARQVRDGLHELARKELLRPARRPSIEGETEYAFWHLLVRDVAYGQIPRASRAAKHRAAAVWIEKIAGERLADSAELLAYHIEQALELARAAGEEVTELEKLAVRFLMLAADRAFRLDVGKAKTYFERVLPLTRPGDPDRYRVLLSLGRVLSELSDDLSDDLLLQAVEEARSVGNVLGEAEALAWLASTGWARGETTRQFELMQEAARILEDRSPSRELAIVLARLVGAHGRAGHAAETLAWSEKGFPVVREFGSEHDLAVVLQFRGQARIEVGDVAAGFEDLREGLRIALERSPAYFAAAAYVNLADEVWFAEGPAKGQELCEVGAELADRRGVSETADWARMESRMWAGYDLGAWDELLKVGELILERDLERNGGAWITQLSVLTEIYRRDVLLHRGILDSEDVVDIELLPRARDIADAQVVVPVFRVAALSRLTRGDVTGAVALAAETDELLRERPGYRSWFLDWASRACLAGSAADFLGSLIEQGTEHLTRDANSMATALAVLAEIEGDYGSAVERYGDAAARWEAFPSVLEHGHALAGAGRCLLALGRPREATECLQTARDVYASLGAASLVAEIGAQLARAWTER